MEAKFYVLLVTFVAIIFLIKISRIDLFKEEIKFIKHYIVPEKIKITGCIVRLYDGDKVLVISGGEGAQIINSSLIPIYYIDVVDIDNKTTTVEIKDFGFVGKLVRRIDDLDLSMTLICYRYSFSKYPFI